MQPPSTDYREVASWNYAEGVQLRAVQRADRTHFEFRGTPLPQCTLETVLGWILPSELSESENPASFYVKFKPVQLDKSTLILTLIDCEVVADPATKKTARMVVSIERKTPCLRIVSEGIFHLVPNENVTGLDQLDPEILQPVAINFSLRIIERIEKIKEFYIKEFDLSQPRIVFSPTIIRIISAYGTSLFTLRVDLSNTVEQLRARLRAKTLKFGDQVLDDHRSLSSYDIASGAPIEISYPHQLGREIVKVPLKGGPDRFSFLRLTSDYEKHLRFISDAPSWRTVYPGLNLEGVCRNQLCLAKDQVVWIPKKFGTFNLRKQSIESNCPSCSELITRINNCGFYKCLYTIQGETSDGQNINRQNVKAPTNTLLTFENLPDNRSFVDYEFLKIITTPLPSSKPSKKNDVEDEGLSLLPRSNYDHDPGGCCSESCKCTLL